MNRDQKVFTYCGLGKAPSRDGSMTEALRIGQTLKSADGAGTGSTSILSLQKETCSQETKLKLVQNWWTLLELGRANYRSAM